MRVVLDSNVVESGIFWQGKPLAILRAWAKGYFDVVGTPEILWEYKRVILELSKKRISPAVEPWLNFFHNRMKLIQPEREIDLCRDPMDNMFLGCAVASRSRYIISGDEDLLVIQKVESTPILNASAFIAKYPQLFS